MSYINNARKTDTREWRVFVQKGERTSDRGLYLGPGAKRSVICRAGRGVFSDVAYELRDQPRGSHGGPLSFDGRLPPFLRGAHFANCVAPQRSEVEAEVATLALSLLRKFCTPRSKWPGATPDGDQTAPEAWLRNRWVDMTSGATPHVETAARQRARRRALSTGLTGTHSDWYCGAPVCTEVARITVPSSGTNLALFCRVWRQVCVTAIMKPLVLHYRGLFIYVLCKALQ